MKPSRLYKLRQDSERIIWRSDGPVVTHALHARGRHAAWGGMAAGIWFTALAVYAIAPVAFLAWSTIEIARWHS